MKEKGFTVIELIIVLGLMSILFFVCVPKFFKKESNKRILNSNLTIIRSTVGMRYVDSIVEKSEFKYPENITEEMFDQNIIPVDPISNNNKVVTTNVPIKGNVVGTDGGWIYNPETGEVRVNHKDYDEL